VNKLDALAALSALGQDTRLEVFRLLVRAGQDGLSAGDIAERLGVFQNTLSTHLKILTSARLIAAKRHGRVILYSADMTGFGDLLGYLMEDCCAGSPALCQPVIDAVTCQS